MSTRSARTFLGAINQTLDYRNKLHRELHNLDEDNEFLQGTLPRCALLIGDTQELDSADKMRSFEAARARRDIDILTFDETRARLEGLRAAMAYEREEEVDGTLIAGGRLVHPEPPTETEDNPGPEPTAYSRDSHEEDKEA